MAESTRTLEATREELWAFLGEPHHLPDWWPGIVAVTPDRRGFALGARWEVRRRAVTLPFGLRFLPESGMHGRVRSQTLVLAALEPLALVEWRLIGRGAETPPLRMRLELEPAGDGRTSVRLTARSGALRGSSDRRTAREALRRLYDLVQPSASG